MIETEITILVNRKSDIEIIKQKIIESNFEFPVYIFEDKNHFRISFASDYEEWELDTKILNSFPEYEFTENPEKGRKEIRLQLSRLQSAHSTDDWGRRIEDPINETKFLIKKSNNSTKVTESELFNSEIKVLFKDNEQVYYINMVNGINKLTSEKGFLLTNNFKTLNHVTKDNILMDPLYKSSSDAFWYGYYKLQDVVNQDFKEYIENQKKALKEQHKTPRKIIRDFINSCNKSEIDGVLKNIDSEIVFERRIDYQTKQKLEGIEEFIEYLKSDFQELIAFNFIVRSPWDIKLPMINISVKFYKTIINKENETINRKLYRQFIFELNNDKICHIIMENLFGT